MQADFSKWCSDRGLRIADAAKLLGVSYVTAWRWHHGTQAPSEMARRLMAQAETAAPSTSTSSGPRRGRAR